MNIHVGDLVQVNAAAFIGSHSPNVEAVPCEVLDLRPGQVYVKTRDPYRVFTLWVSRDWVENAPVPLQSHSA